MFSKLTPNQISALYSICAGLATMGLSLGILEGATWFSKRRQGQKLAKAYLEGGEAELRRQLFLMNIARCSEHCDYLVAEVKAGVAAAEATKAKVAPPPAATAAPPAATA